MGWLLASAVLVPLTAVQLGVLRALLCEAAAAIGVTLAYCLLEVTPGVRVIKQRRASDNSRRNESQP
jgi:hypothetical protein